MTTTLKIRQEAIREVLEKLYLKYNRRDLIKPDPLQFIYKYSSREDMEKVGIELTIEQCQGLKKNGVNRFHFFTLNRVSVMKEILEAIT